LTRIPLKEKKITHIQQPIGKKPAGIRKLPGIVRKNEML